MRNLNMTIILATTAILLVGCAKSESKKSIMEVHCNANECVQNFIKKRPIKINGLSPRVPQYETTEWVSVHSSNHPMHDTFRNNTDLAFSSTGWIRVPTNYPEALLRSKKPFLNCSMRYNATVCWSRRLSTSVSSSGNGFDLITAFEHINDMLAEDEEVSEKEP